MYYELNVVVGDKSHSKGIDTNELVTLATLFGGYPLSTWLDIKNAVGDYLRIYARASLKGTPQLFSTQGYGSSKDAELSQWLINVYYQQLPNLVDKITTQARTHAPPSLQSLQVRLNTETVPPTHEIIYWYPHARKAITGITVINPDTGEFILT